MKAWIVGIGGIVGALARYGLSLLFIVDGGFPTHTFIINMTGCFLLSALLAVLSLDRSAHPYWKAGIGTGFLGAFTTFSTFSYETINLITEYGNWTLAAVYVVVSLWGGLFMSWIGFRLVMSFSRRMGRLTE